MKSKNKLTQIKVDSFSMFLLIWALLLIFSYLWLKISHAYVARVYPDCIGKMCLTWADLIGGIFLHETFLYFKILLLIKIFIVLLKQMGNKFKIKL